MGLKGSFAAKIAAGAAGFGVAVAAAPYPVDNVFQMGPLARKLMSSPTGKVLVRSSQVGGAVAMADLLWSNRQQPSIVYGNMQLVYSELPDLWRDTRAVKRKPKTKSRRRDGPSILSQRTSKSPSFGKKRRRCKHRNKAGKHCLRPAGHSGRHRYS